MQKDVMMAGPLKIGILGCAAVAEYALLAPAKNIASVQIVAAASRDPERAREFCARNDIPRALSYENLICDPEVDAIYNPLPNALHAEWSLRALAAGKAVLCEKPFTSNATEAAALVKAAKNSEAMLVEAMHWRYHPIAARITQLLHAGTIGEVRHVAVAFLIPDRYLTTDNIRFDYRLGGGVTMDCGCYCLSLIHLVLGAPERIVSARAETGPPQIDVVMQAELAFPGGATARLDCSHKYSGQDFHVQALITGTAGSLRVDQPFMPHLGSAIEIETPGAAWREALTQRSSYHFQLEAFPAILRGETVPKSTLEDALLVMRSIDAIYDAAGLQRRGE